ncbi:hypothetical protein PS662_03750 [Pseudomonas fluorescens]|uniref:RHS repeat-associated core domain-containing protein n=1 Tax=Pseudomonas fluorescens TaxID=294 RepID=A0A5E6UTB7_PSEFL|nr:RHS repeat-associated core domain-containing protein [Pseudomonas fluorescens]VVN09005.1 hypothetical protein PS662_03750 [Pseudomonas fluorescens]
MQSPSTTPLCQYHYDALDKLVASALPNEPKYQRFYCKGRLATEIHGATIYSIVQHEDQLLAQQQSQGNAIDTALLSTDPQRSVLNTGKANQPRQHIAYTPYGHRPASSGLLSLVAFCGERQDSKTGWYLLGNGYRPFNPVLMRFTSPDSISPFGKGGLNAYVYCGGDPRNRIDPTGQNWFSNISNMIKISAPKELSSVKTDKVIKALKKANEYYGSDFERNLQNLTEVQRADALFERTIFIKTLSIEDLTKKIAAYQLTGSPTFQKVIESLHRTTTKKFASLDNIQQHYRNFQAETILDRTVLKDLRRTQRAPNTNSSLNTARPTSTAKNIRKI